MSDLVGNFRYVFIPADASRPMEVREGRKSGGLQDDVLAKEARRYFFEEGGGAERAAALEQASPEERKQIAQQVRQQIMASAGQGGGGGGAGQLSQLDDDALINMVRSTQSSATCEIIALTVPTKGNHHHAVSMYGADDARVRNLPRNDRASALMAACGHALPTDTTTNNTNDNNNDNDTTSGGGGGGGVHGDVFVGRCRDDEQGDIWERLDFGLDDADPSAEWCAVAKQKGGGGGSSSRGGGAAPPSLSGVMTQALSSGTAVGGGAAASSSSMMERDLGYRWSQTEDEVELKFSVASGTKAKYVKVNFGRNALKITVAGQTLVNGATGGPVSTDESTFTIQDEGDGRELCVILGKNDASTWGYAVKPK